MSRGDDENLVPPLAFTLEQYLMRMVVSFREVGPLLSGLLIEAQNDDAIRRTITEELIGPRTKVIAEIVKVDNSHLSDAEVATRVTMMSGAFWYHLLLGAEIP